MEEFGSVYEGILEMQPYVTPATDAPSWQFGFVGGLDRKSTSSYYTRPDLVQSLIRTTLEPVIKEIIAKYQTREEQVKALLAMKVCDAASGSGHIALAMARTIAWYVCSIRTGEDNPASLDYREALREVIQKCVYAVDFNPDAVELCKVVLWIEGYCAGMPLSFLDHHIRCGNSVVGVADLDVLLKGVPNDAFSSDNREVLRQVKALNNTALREIREMEEGGLAAVGATLFDSDSMIERIDSEQIGLAAKVKEISALPETTLLEELTKQKRWEDLMQSPRVECLRRACDIYTYAFYKQFKEEDLQAGEDLFSAPIAIPYSKTVYRALEEIKHLSEKNADFHPLDDNFKNEILAAAKKYRFFHWCVEFPEVFANEGGFDVMCGNPPWDKLQMEDEKWFVGKNQEIVDAPNQAARDRLIVSLEHTDKALFAEYQAARKEIASQSCFVKSSTRFQLTNVGKIDLYPLFAELCLSFSKEAWGLVIPTGIAVNDSSKLFFSKLIDENRLISLYSFENEEKIFQIHHSFKFCLLTAGKANANPRKVSGGFYLRRIDHLLDPNRIYTLQTSDFSLLNPNSKTCPIFRTSKDAFLTAKIYRQARVIMNDHTRANPWNIRFGSMLNLSTDSYLFKTYEQLMEQGAVLKGNRFTTHNGIDYVPLYEGKMIWHYNHHYGTWPTTGGVRPNTIDIPSVECLSNPYHNIMPWYWVPLSEVEKRNIKTNNEGEVIWEWKHSFLIGFRDVTSSITERTFVVSLIPAEVGVGNSTTLLYADGAVANTLALATASSLPFDYVARQKIGGSHASISFVKQFPVIPFEQISLDLQWEITQRVAELTYFNHDLDGWAEELYNELSDEQKQALPQLGQKQPFIYNPDRRAVLQAELDAIIGHLYGLNTEDMRYILDPEDICGPGCINETFRVLKDNEIRQYGEYRTKRLVMDAWYRFGYDR